VVADDERDQEMTRKKKEEIYLCVGKNVSKCTFL
jgi:hypothetical protein